MPLSDATYVTSITTPLFAVFLLESPLFLSPRALPSPTNRKPLREDGRENALHSIDIVWIGKPLERNRVESSRNETESHTTICDCDICNLSRNENISKVEYHDPIFDFSRDRWEFFSPRPRQKLIQRCFSRMSWTEQRRCLAAGNATGFRLKLLPELSLLTEMRSWETIEAESRAGIVLSKSVKAVTRRQNDRLLANCIPLCPPLSCLSVSSQSRPPFFFSLSLFTVVYSL